MEGAHHHVAVLQHPDRALALLAQDHRQGQPAAADHAAGHARVVEVELVARGHRHALQARDRRLQGGVVEAGEELDRTEARQVGHELATSAIAATTLTVAWALTDPQ